MQGTRNFGQLAIVRRFEAGGFRAWPASIVSYDGAWVIRLTPGHEAKRLNSVNPLDPGDSNDIAGRVAHAARLFEAQDKPLTFRLSPLAGPHLTAYFDQQGWSRFSESIVMRAPLATISLDGAMHQIPLKDRTRFLAAARVIRGADYAGREALGDILTKIQPEAGLFVLEDDGKPVAAAVCVHDGDLAGLFEVITGASERGKGHARRLLMSALKWARLRGAHEGWLQVEADNEAAVRLYSSLGYSEIYRYHYRRPPGA